MTKKSCSCIKVTISSYTLVYWHLQLQVSPTCNNEIVTETEILKFKRIADSHLLTSIPTLLFAFFFAICNTEVFVAAQTPLWHEQFG